MFIKQAFLGKVTPKVILYLLLLGESFLKKKDFRLNFSHQFQYV